LAAKAAWDFAETQKPHFELVTMLEQILFTPPANAESSSRMLKPVNSPMWPVATGVYPQQR
jgi:hypothetical protein